MTNIEKAYSLLRVVRNPKSKKALTELTIEMTVNELAYHLKVQQPEASFILKRLKDIGVVKYRKVGRNVFYSKDSKRLTHMELLCGQL